MKTKTSSADMALKGCLQQERTGRVLDEDRERSTRGKSTTEHLDEFASPLSQLAQSLVSIFGSGGLPMLLVTEMHHDLRCGVDAHHISESGRSYIPETLNRSTHGKSPEYLSITSNKAA